MSTSRFPIVWQVMSKGVRPVLVRRQTAGCETADVSRRGGPLHVVDGRGVRDWSPHTTLAPITDLFATELLAQAEFRLRRDIRRSPLDRRILREQFRRTGSPARPGDGIR